MSPDTTDYPQPRLILYLILIVTMLSPTLKVLSSFQGGGAISNPAHNASSDDMKIPTIGKDSVPVSITDIAPVSVLILRKSASFEHLVRTVSMIKGLHN